MTDPVMDTYALAQVGIGCHVELELIDVHGSVEAMHFDLVRDDAADLDRGFLGEATPLGKAIRGKHAGATVAYQMGDICQVKIVRVEVATQTPQDDARARRQAILDEARRKAERTSAEMFAASYDGKWGDYELGEETNDEQER